MSDHDFKVGDVVRLKVGGPGRMLVQTLLSGGAIECMWMDGNKKYEESFKPELLEHVPDDEDELPIVSEYDD